MSEVIKHRVHIDYINNTKMIPIKPEVFDEDWEPIGPMVRASMLRDGVIYEGSDTMIGTEPGIYLRPDLVEE